MTLAKQVQKLTAVRYRLTQYAIPAVGAGFSDGVLESGINSVLNGIIDPLGNPLDSIVDPDLGNDARQGVACSFDISMEIRRNDNRDTLRDDRTSSEVNAIISRKRCTAQPGAITGISVDFVSNQANANAVDNVFDYDAATGLLTYSADAGVTYGPGVNLKYRDIVAIAGVNNSSQYAITGVTTGAGGTFTIAGNYAAEFAVGAQFVVSGSSGNDGSYTVAGVAYTGGNTVITISGSIGDSTVDGNIEANTLTFTGNYTDIFYLNEQFDITGSTGNDGTYTVRKATYNGTSTTVILVESLADPTVDGSARPYVIENDVFILYADAAGTGTTYVFVRRTAPALPGTNQTADPITVAGAQWSFGLCTWFDGARKAYYNDDTGVEVDILFPVVIHWSSLRPSDELIDTSTGFLDNVPPDASGKQVVEILPVTSINSVSPLSHEPRDPSKVEMFINGIDQDYGTSNHFTLGGAGNKSITLYPTQIGYNVQTTDTVKVKYERV